MRKRRSRNSSWLWPGNDMRSVARGTSVSCSECTARASIDFVRFLWMPTRRTSSSEISSVCMVVVAVVVDSRFMLDWGVPTLARETVVERFETRKRTKLDFFFSHRRYSVRHRDSLMTIWVTGGTLELRKHYTIPVDDADDSTSDKCSSVLINRGDDARLMIEGEWKIFKDESESSLAGSVSGECNAYLLVLLINW